MRIGSPLWIVALCVAWFAVSGPAVGDDQDAGVDPGPSSCAGPVVSPSGHGETAISLALGGSAFLGSALPST